jgi:hypothetical protein
VDDGIDAGHRRGERVRSGDVADADLDVGAPGERQATDDGLAGGRGAGEGDDLVSRGEQDRDEMAADEAAGAGHEDGGHDGMVLRAQGRQSDGRHLRFGRDCRADAPDGADAGIVASSA